MTRPRSANGMQMDKNAAMVAAEQIERTMLLAPDSSNTYQIWRNLVVKYDIRGVQVHDAKLVANMQVNRIRHLLTLNTKDFARFDGIFALEPYEWLEIFRVS